MRMRPVSILSNDPYLQSWIMESRRQRVPNFEYGMVEQFYSGYNAHSENSLKIPQHGANINTYSCVTRGRVRRLQAWITGKMRI